MTTAAFSGRRSLFSASRRGRSFALVALLAVGMNGVCCQSARADGGALQTSERAGPWIVSVFTSPTPPTVGPVDVSVLVQRADTKETVTDASIRLVAREASSGFTLERIATREAATNKLFQAAWFDLPTAGAWVVTAQVAREEETADVTLDVWISNEPAAWSALSLWIAWPIVPIGLYASRQFRVARRKVC